ncbi:MAG: galactose-1-phosphate uridylyltransferase [Candidatus Odinarchaeia archaeon]
MQEIRKDYLTDNMTIIVENRKHRPRDAGAENRLERCPFCPRNEEMTPRAEIVFIKTDKGVIVKKDEEDIVYKNWSVRIFPNLYPALIPTPYVPCSNELLEKFPAQGLHYVIVETPHHMRPLNKMSEEEVEIVFNAYSEIFKKASRKEFVKYLSLFKNYKKEAGASLLHPHSQLIALPFVPRKIKEEARGLKKTKNKACLFEEIIENEKYHERIISESTYFIAFCPFAPTVDFEVWIAPKEHVMNISKLNSKKLKDLASLTRRILQRLRDVLNDPPYNMIFHQSLDDPMYHMNLRILPKVSDYAGFEMNTGVSLITVPPEKAAKMLKF